MKRDDAPSKRRQDIGVNLSGPGLFLSWNHGTEGREKAGRERETGNKMV